jgi:tRNA 2-thiouridine synthesizing protein A
MQEKLMAANNFISSKKTEINIAKTLDATGQLCPQLIFDADSAIHAIKIGETIEIISTDSATKNCVSDWCDYTGHVLLKSKFDKNTYKYHYFVKRVKKTF